MTTGVLITGVVDAGYREELDILVCLRLEWIYFTHEVHIWGLKLTMLSEHSFVWHDLYAHGVCLERVGSAPMNVYIQLNTFTDFTFKFNKSIISERFLTAGSASDKAELFSPLCPGLKWLLLCPTCCN